MPLTGLEPVRGRPRGILSPLCLPIPPQRHIYLQGLTTDIIAWGKEKIKMNPAGGKETTAGGKNL